MDLVTSQHGKDGSGHYRNYIIGAAGAVLSRLALIAMPHRRPSTQDILQSPRPMPYAVPNVPGGD